ncbi:MAG: BlaI/MecI/CopY family transcriptional regulator [Oscillospiraceae bacterium]|nr:BlaI/MecI/CopY family transcriptional regulator [Oscillospiraceae bacterium]
MIINLSKNELQVMTVLWQAGAPLTGSQIKERSAGKGWKDRSLHSILNNLMDKGAISIHGSEKDGKALSRTFITALSLEDYYGETLSECSPAALLRVISLSIQKRPKLDPETVDKMEELLRELQEKLREKVDK